MEQSAVSSYSSQMVEKDPTPRTTFDRATPYRRSYVNDAVEVLRGTGRSMKLQELQSSIGHKRGKAVSLGSLKVCLSRYVDTADSSKLLTRVAPGLFALSEWGAAGMAFHGHPGLSQTDDYGAFGGNPYARMPGSYALPVNDASLSVFVWTAPADEHSGKREQLVYVKAIDERDAVSRLQYAGVQDAELGSVRPL